MFASRYFAPQYYAPRYWPSGGDGPAVEADNYIPGLLARRRRIFAA